MLKKEPIFDIEKAKATIEKGERSKWWRRKGSMARGFYFVDANGQRISNDEHLDRIRAMVIPPAWRHVRISPAAGSRLQAVGMDTTGRIQYLYHPRFSARQRDKKFSRIASFGKFLPQLRTVTNEHITLDGFPREKILAVMLRLINSLYFRVGTEKSVKHYRTYGITTLKNKHLQIGRNGELIFDFVGKSHVHHRKILVDEELASIMKEIKELGGARQLFHYIDEDGKPRQVKPGDLNNYLKAATAPEYSAKDFRTWGGSLLAAIQLAEAGTAADESILKKNIVRAVKNVAKQLGNTPTVCRSSYIHPAVLSAYENGKTIEDFAPRKKRTIKRIQIEPEPEEMALLKLLTDL
ncbi:MAG: DNA topoisomerase IB [Pyrinomonadaceae bacterium]